MTTIPVHIKDLLCKLEYLAMIEKGKKPCLSDMTFVDGTSWVGAAKRSRNSESKKSLLLFIDTTIDQTFSALQDPRNQEYVSLLLSALSRAKIGIANTEPTYQHVPSYISAIRVTLTNIDHQLKKYEIDKLFE